MIDPGVLDELAKRLADAVPQGMRELQSDLDRNVRATVQSVLGKLDLVTREEFEVQTEVLARTRQYLTTLEGRVAQLEQVVLKREPAPRGPRRRHTPRKKAPANKGSA